MKDQHTLKTEKSQYIEKMPYLDEINYFYTLLIFCGVPETKKLLI